MFGGQYGEKLYDNLWLYNLNNNLWQNTIIADAGHLYPGFFYNCTDCASCKRCKKESATLAAELAITPPERRVRRFCKECSPCKTGDWEAEELSLYDKIDPAQTNCTKCKYCFDQSPNIIEILIEEKLDYNTFEQCEECEMCSACSNGIGLKSPPGLRGHTMLVGK